MIGINEEAKKLRISAELPLPDLMPIDFNHHERKPRHASVAETPTAQPEAKIEMNNEPELTGAINE
jgi:hypothetical protein